MLRLLAQREEGYEDIGALMGLSDGEVRSKVKDALAALERGDPGDDQKAMLRLLAQREEGYGDIGALMGLSDGEVRSRVRASLAELDGESPPPPAPTPTPTPAQPPEPAPAPKRPKAKPAPAKSLLQNKRLLAQVGGCVAIVLLLVLFASGVIDVGGSDGNSGGSETTPTAVSPTSNSKVPTQAILKGVDGSDAEGRAIFGRLKDQVLLVVAAKGLAPSPQGSSYAISLARSSDERIPIAATKVAKAGTISGQFQVPATALSLLASGFDEMEVSLVANDELRAAVTQAQQKKKTPQFEGTDVLRGTVTGPVIQAAEEESG